MIKNPKNTSYPYLIIGILIFVGLGGIWLWRNDKLNIKITHQTSVIEKNSSIPTDWLVYETTLYSFRYPTQIEAHGTKNAVLIRDGVQNDKTKDDYFEWPASEPNASSGRIKEIIVNGKPGYVQKSTIQHVGAALMHNRQITIENIRFFKNEEWHQDGVLNIRISIDEGLWDIDAITYKILKSFKFRDLDSEEPVNIKIGNLKMNVPNTWWYRCINATPDSWNNKSLIAQQKMVSFSEHQVCSFNFDANVPIYLEDGSFHAPFRIWYHPNKNDFDLNDVRKLITRVSENVLEVSGHKFLLTKGVVDPEKFNYSTLYAKNDEIAIVEMANDTGIYEFLAVTKEDKTGRSYDQQFKHLLSSFEFVEE